MKSDLVEKYLRRFAQGRCSLAALEEIGVRTELGEGTASIDHPCEKTVELRMEDIASGLVLLKDNFQDLRCWATILICGSNIFDLEERFDSDPRGNVLLNALWDVTFGDRPSSRSLEVANRLLEAADG